MPTNLPQQTQGGLVLGRQSWGCKDFLRGLAAKLPPVGPAWSLESKGQETGCRVHVTV